MEYVSLDLSRALFYNERDADRVLICSSRRHFVCEIRFRCRTLTMVRVVVVLIFCLAVIICR